MKNLKKLTILHSNDLHGDFLAENVDSKLVGGVSMLSGYINKVRDEEENVIYCIAGDMFRGSLIDSETRGVDTINIMNMLAPDVVTLGNHEVDYGLAHLLFLEKYADFPIINANMYIKNSRSHKRIFAPYRILRVGGMNVLFIGILTEDVLASTKNEGLIGTLVNIEDAAAEVAKINDGFKSMDIDFTVLLTHIGFEQDKKLAAALDPACGVDIIIGGHSHTLIHEPAIVNGIPVVQAAIGTDQIGRFDIMVDIDNNCIDSYKWELIPINEHTCPVDEEMKAIIYALRDKTDAKYGEVITSFPRVYTHPRRNMETELGDIFAEGMREQLGVDLVFLASGSIRKPTLGKYVTLKDYMEIFPFTDPMYEFKMTGAQLKTAIKFMLRDEAFLDGDHTEFYQISRGFYCEYEMASHSIKEIKMNGKDVADDDMFTVSMQRYHFVSIKDFLGVPMEDIEKNGKPRVIAVKSPNVLEEYFRAHAVVIWDEEKRLNIK